MAAAGDVLLSRRLRESFFGGQKPEMFTVDSKLRSSTVSEERLRCWTVLHRTVSLQNVSLSEVVMVGSCEAASPRSGHTEWATSMAKWPFGEAQ